MSNSGQISKGEKRGRGRPPGVKNKSTLIAREAIARFVDGNAEKLQEWLDEIAEKEGALAAFRCFTDVVEYHVPKLQRTELTGKDGGAIEVKAQPQDERL